MSKIAIASFESLHCFCRWCSDSAVLFYNTVTNIMSCFKLILCHHVKVVLFLLCMLHLKMIVEIRPVIGLKALTSPVIMSDLMSVN